jgi:hypothetical protein
MAQAAASGRVTVTKDVLQAVLGSDLSLICVGTPSAANGTAGLTILTLEIDALALPRIRLVTIDAEGHELSVLRGMRRLLERDHPVLIVETGSRDTTELLGDLDYFSERLPGSSNLLCEHRESRQ